MIHKDMSSSSIDSSGIFSDAVNIVPGQYSSSNYGSSSVVGQYNSGSSQELGMLVGDGIVLSPNEAQMFKMITKIIAANKNLKKALATNGERLRDHVNDCIQWKENHKLIEDGLKDQLKTEKHKSSMLQKRLDFLNTTMSTSSMAVNSSSNSFSSMDHLINELNKQSKMLIDVLHASNESSQSPNEPGVVKEAYEASIGAIREFVTGRKFDTLDEALSNVQNFSIPLISHDGKILRDAITSIQNASKDYQNAVNSVRSGPQIPLVQHLEIKNMLETIMEENEQLKNQIKNYAEESSEKDNIITKLKKEKEELVFCNSEQKNHITKLMDDLDNCHSVELLDFTPQQQPKEIKQLEANIECYKKTINLLKERNETLHGELTESNAAFEKVDDENSDLRDQCEQLNAEVARLNDILNCNCSSYFHPVVDMSPEQQKITLQQYSLKIVELEKSNKILNEELVKLRGDKLVSYELPDPWIGNQRITELEQEVCKLSKLLQLKENELESVKKEMDGKAAGELNTSTVLHDMMEELKIKDEEIKNSKGECLDLLNNIKAMEEQLKDQRTNFETKSRVQKNRESKDADWIDNLKKQNSELRKEVERMKNENEELRQHIESFNSAIHQQNLSGKQQFANLLGKSEELMSIDSRNGEGDNVQLDSMNSEYTQSLLNENTQLLEELEKLRMDMEQVEEENQIQKMNIEKLSLADGNSTQRYTELQTELNQLLEKLRVEAQENAELQHANRQLEEQLSNQRNAFTDLQQQLQASNVNIKNFDELQDQLVAAKMACEKLKRDNQQTWDKLQTKVKNVKDLEGKVQELTTEIVGAQELIGDQQNKERIANEMIAALQENERRTKLEVTQMRDQVDEVGVLRMQLDVYKNDFQAERDSREKQQAALLEERERVQQLQLENHRLLEELQKKGDQRLNSMRQRYNTMDPRQSYMNNQQNYNPQHYGQDVRPQGVDQHGGDNQWQQQRSVNDWQVYGRGNEQNDPRRSAHRQQNNRMDEDEQRKCPKCQEVQPDLDSLQIHVMECLDK